MCMAGPQWVSGPAGLALNQRLSPLCGLTPTYENAEDLFQI